MLFWVLLPSLPLPPFFFLRRSRYNPAARASISGMRDGASLNGASAGSGFATGAGVARVRVVIKRVVAAMSFILRLRYLWDMLAGLEGWVDFFRGWIVDC